MPGRTKIAKIALISRAAMRSVAVFAAVITLAGQLAAASHIHQAADPCGVNAVAQVSPDGGLCALCLLAFHTSANPPATPVVGMPLLVAQPAVAAATVSIASIDSTCALTRAPPRSA
jgi:hypothetical protein